MTLPKAATLQEKDTRDGHQPHATHIPARTVLPHKAKHDFLKKLHTCTTHTPFFFVFSNR